MHDVSLYSRVLFDSISTSHTFAGSVVYLLPTEAVRDEDEPQLVGLNQLAMMIIVVLLLISVSCSEVESFTTTTTSRVKISSSFDKSVCFNSVFDINEDYSQVLSLTSTCMDRQKLLILSTLHAPIATKGILIRSPTAL